jgi:hypothetical protein
MNWQGNFHLRYALLVYGLECASLITTRQWVHLRNRHIVATVETHLLFTSASAIMATHNFLDFTEENADVGGGTSDASHGAGKASDDMAEREWVSSTTSPR